MCSHFKCLHYADQQLKRYFKYIFCVPALLLAGLWAGALTHSGEAAGKFDDKDLPQFSLFLPGKRIYEKNCIMCHGEKGDGTGPMGLTLEIKPRDFRKGVFKYRSTGGEALPTTDDLMRTVRTGVTGTAMPTFAHLPEKDLRAVVEYIKFFSPRWNDPANYGQPLPPASTPDWMDDGEKLKAHRAKGAELFIVACVPCHGPKGEGNGPNADKLLDAWNHPIKPANLLAERLRNGDESPAWFRVLTVGIAGTPMASFAESLTPEQRWEIVAYLQQLRTERVRPAE